MMKTIFILLIATSWIFRLEAQDFTSIKRGITLHEKGKYEKSNYYLENSIEGVKKVFGENDTVILPIIYYFASTNYFKLNDFNQSIAYAKNAVKIYDANKNVKNLDYLVLSCQNLGVIYQNYGYYDIATKYWKRAYEIAKLGPLNENLIELSYGLGTALSNSGNNLEAEKYLLESLEQTKKLHGARSMKYATTSNTLGVLFLELGNYDKAESLVKTSVEIKKEIAGEKSQTYITSFGNLAIIYQKTGKFEESEDVYLKNIELAKAVVGEKDALYAINLFNLGYLYYKQKKFKKASINQELAYSIILSNQGKTHPYYAPVCSGLGLTFLNLKDYNKSAFFLLEAKIIQEKKLGKNHVIYATTLFNLGKCYNKKGKIEEANKYFKEALSIYNNNIFQNFSYLSEKEKEMYFTTKEEEINGFYDFAVSQSQNIKDITDIIYNNILITKGILLKSSTAMRNSVANSNDTALQALYNDWIMLKMEISKLNSLEINQRHTDPAKLEPKADSLERLLALKVSGFSEFEKVKSLTWTMVRDNLKAGEVAIEFLRYKSADDSIFYVALLIEQECEHPKLIRMFEEGQLKNLMAKYAGSNFELISGLYGTREKPNSYLFDLIWKPLLPHLASAKTIYYSPDGLLHKISLAGILSYKNIFLTSIYNLQFVSTTASISKTTQSSSLAQAKVCVYGGADFDLGAKTIVVWNYLPGTKLEAENIGRIMAKSNMASTIKTGVEATESNLKLEAPGYDILHIATHGFFFLDPAIIEDETKNSTETSAEALAFRSVNGTAGKNQFVNSTNPLMRSGLVFSGANKVWSNMEINTADDGVLTASEVVQLNLSKAKLVVLSACETGLGEIKGSEGVYGLQRAFKMAGANYLIMSLWQVPDKETAKFMEQFYTLLTSGKDIRSAFAETQEIMSKQLDPYFWAAFVLIE